MGFRFSRTNHGEQNRRSLFAKTEKGLLRIQAGHSRTVTVVLFIGLSDTSIMADLIRLNSAYAGHIAFFKMTMDNKRAMAEAYAKLVEEFPSRVYARWQLEPRPETAGGWFIERPGYQPPDVPELVQLPQPPEQPPKTPTAEQDMQFADEFDINAVFEGIALECDPSPSASHEVTGEPLPGPSQQAMNPVGPTTSQAPAEGGGG